MTTGRRTESTPPKWVCPTCGYGGLRFGITKATVEVSVAVGCPVCSGELFRDDPLGRIEMETSVES